MLERGLEKRVTSHTVSGNVTWYTRYRKEYGGSLKRLKIELSEDPRVPLLDIYMRAYLVAQFIKNLPAMRETWVQSLSWEDPLEEYWQPTRVFLPSEAPWTEEPVL